MSINVAPILNAVESHAKATGLFERVNTHEPKNAPGNGLSAAIWAQTIGPARGQSGLNRTTVLVVFTVRLLSNMLQEPQDAIDPNLIDAVDVLMAAYSGDFDLGESVRNVDLLGASGTPLSARAGYVNQDGKIFRVMDITLPLIINDVWAQVR